MATLEPPVTQMVHRSDKEILRRPRQPHCHSPPPWPHPRGDRDRLSGEQGHPRGAPRFRRQDGPVLAPRDPRLGGGPLPPHAARSARHSTRLFGTKSETSPSSFRPERTAHWSLMNRVTIGLPISNPIAVGNVLREMPLFLSSGLHVPVPLESTYWQPGTSLPRNSAAPSKRASCRSPTRINGGWTE